MGVYFISQSPLDIPDSILGQLGLKIQHALRAYTPRDRKIIKSVAQSFPSNPKFDTERVITELGIGEALVSVLDEKGRPRPVQHTLIRPPESRIGPLSEDERRERIERSPLKGRYDHVVDRESAYEILKERAREAEAHQDRESREKAEQRRKSGSGRKRQGMTEAFFKSTARSIGNQVGRQIIRGIMGSLFGGRK